MRALLNSAILSADLGPAQTTNIVAALIVPGLAAGAEMGQPTGENNVIPLADLAPAQTTNMIVALIVPGPVVGAEIILFKQLLAKIANRQGLAPAQTTNMIVALIANQPAVGAEME